MRDWLFILTVLALLAAIPAAVLTNVSYDVNTSKWNGAQVGRDTQWRPFLTPDQAASVGTDVEAGQYDYFNSTREHPEAGVGALSIDRPHVCSGDDIPFVVYYLGQPVSGANVGLYSHTNGRALIGEVTTDAYGRAVFIRQANGGYDLYATYRGYQSALDVFYIGPCVPGFDTYRQAATMPPTAAAQSTVSITYASGITRTLTAVSLPAGQEGTEVTLAYNLTSDLNNAVLDETISTQLAGNTKAVGFDSDYPSFISNSTPVALGWQLPFIPAGRSLTRSYVLLRRFSPDMLQAYGEPAIVDGQGQVLVGSQVLAGGKSDSSGSQGANGTMSNDSAHASAGVGANSNSAGAELVGLVGGWNGMLIIGMVLAAGLMLLLWTGLRQPARKAPPPKEKE